MQKSLINRSGCLMKILLTTLHAKYSHASLALPCLAACCRDIPGVTLVIREWTANEPAEHLLRQIMAEQADLVAFSCYIWNIEKTVRIASDIKRISGDTLIAMGGPEVSFGVFELMHANPAVDFVVKGEGEAVFRRLVELLALQGNFPMTPSPHRGLLPENPVYRPEGEGTFDSIHNLFFRDGADIASGPLGKDHVALDTIPSPFEAGLVDLNKALVYYETSRGCPFSCAFCLSSVEGQVRSFSAERIRNDLMFLMGQGVSHVKLVDRTFNYDAQRAGLIWAFILEHNRASHFHFEIAADLLTEENLALLTRVPEKTFRFEIGIQSTSEETLNQVGRTGSLARIFENVRRLRAETQVELHLDLVAGLPGEGYAGFLDSLEQVAGLMPHEIQIEPLKVLKGAPMREIARQEEYRFSDFPPYTILATPWLSFEEIGRIETIGRLLDLFYNHGGFTASLRFLQRERAFVHLFDQMARLAGTENLSGFSTRRAYELFSRLAVPLVTEADRPLFHELLFFDYCQSEMPRMGKLPSFAANRHRDCTWPGRGELPSGMDLPAGSRVKAFRFIFSRDFRSEPWGEGPASVTFVYASAAGQGLRVVVV
jgi:anaerobic magnesium-protoporphyrin IX monomethyl ester cyclase